MAFPAKLKPAKDDATLKIVVEHAPLLIADNKIKPLRVASNADPGSTKRRYA
jgi:hypothetical protein